MAVQVGRGLLSDAMRGNGPATGAAPDPPRGGDDCPYCAMWPHVTLAMHFALLAHQAEGRDVLDYYQLRGSEELRAALMEGARSEVVTSERGAEVLDQMRAIAATAAIGFEERARQLWDIGQALAALAEGRNRGGDGSEA